MKKILWLVHPLNFSEELCQFPAHLAKLINGEITVAFIDAGIYENIPLISDSNVLPTREYKIGNMRINEEKKELAETNRQLIRKYFTAHNQQVTLHIGEELSCEEILGLSRFSDLLLTQVSLSSMILNPGQVSPFVKKVLANAACPVLLMPDDHQEIEEIVFTYNGSDSSLYAIRQFTQLFEGLKETPVTILYISVKEREIPHRKELISYLSGHYSHFNFRVLEGEPANELMIELMYRKNTVVTFGAFGRNSLSNLLHPSDSEKVLQIADLPVFITHP